MNWTKDQQKVIDLRNRNILVSAAAGSGKTAVLVERIITMISEGDNPIDIDRLLIVTFTNAAAAEMRERIGMAIEKKVKDNPDNTHLQKQMMLIHTAQITTIHSFCLFVIRNYFNEIKIDPSFRIGNESELLLLKTDVIEDLLEQYYEKGDESFLNFIESFASSKTDESIENLILKLHNFSMSFPWPKEWLEEKKDLFYLDSLENMEKTNWMKSLKDYLASLINDMIERCQLIISLCEEEDGPEAYLEAISSDKKQLEDLRGLTSYEEYYEGFTSFKFKRLSGKKQEGICPEKKELVKSIRNEIKAVINDDIKKQYFFQSPDEMLKDIQAMKSPMKVLVDIIEEFSNAYSKKKSEKNLVDYNDLEHFCLNILVNKKGDEIEYSQAANELADFYEEILIDEYQDSNLVQETILNSISKERFGRPNRFMVGDVKQSIYKFRLARPEIFMEKYKFFDLEESKNQRVDLHQNFRSRDIILDSVNLIFEQIMTKKLGNIIYDDKAALYPGADYGSQTEGISNETEVILVSCERDMEDIEEEDIDGKELEAKAIALRIKELVDEKSGLQVLDKETKEYRLAKYKDIVILLRTMNNWSDIFVEVLGQEGIPSYAQTQRGYFNTLEIKTIINLLKVIDNPRQDIPFTAILRSPIVDLNSNELARIRMVNRDGTMYEAMMTYIDSNQEEKRDPLGEKLELFKNNIYKFRDMVSYLTINELLIKVLDDTGYYNFVSAMPSGEKRKANIDMLIQKAIQFKDTSYTGLFHFIRYIEKLHKYDIDFGEAESVSGSDNSVRIMSIHKSKGLEFPLVFVSGMGKEFNLQDTKDKIVVDPDLGIGPDFVDVDLRVKAPTLIKKMIQKNIILESLGEELRILYVAMTRAKEKLILTGSVKEVDKSIKKWSSIGKQKEDNLPFYQLSGAKSFLDWLIPSILRLENLEVFHRGKKMDYISEHTIIKPGKFTLNIINQKDLLVKELVEQLEKEDIKSELLSWDSNKIFDESIYSSLEQVMNYQYPFQAETKIHAKLSVTELKKMSQLEEDLSVKIKGIDSSNETSIVPTFIKEREVVQGANLGTLYHNILNNRKILEIKSKTQLENYLNKLHKSGNLKLEEYEAINQKKLLNFLTSEIAERMRLSAKEDKLFTEGQFIMGIPGNEVNSQIKSNELVLIQGVIDVFFIEGEDIVLLDYKTDKVDSVYGEVILIKRYSLQLDYYKKALEQLTGKKVKEQIIYSFELDKEIIL